MAETAEQVTERKKRERRARRDRLGKGAAIVHGRLSSYNQWGCRCGPCTEAYMAWYSVYAVSRRKPGRKSLPRDLKRLCESVGSDVAALIQEQYDDDQSQRIGFAASLDAGFDLEKVLEVELVGPELSYLADSITDLRDFTPLSDLALLMEGNGSRHRSRSPVRLAS